MDFPAEILSPQRVIFRQGAIDALFAEAFEFGPRGFVVHGPSFEKNGGRERLSKTLPPGAEVEFFQRHGGEPTLDEVSQVIERGRRARAFWIAGIGGGSALDLAKAAAGLFRAAHSPLYYQEGGALQEKGIPFIAVPTTAGTGAEATGNAVIINPAKKTKLSVRDKSFMARKVILDPGLLAGLDRRVMAFSAMDALVQGYESFISKNATWYSDTFAIKAVELVSRNLVPAIETGAEVHRTALMLGSYFAGVALAAARLGVIHGIAHPLGVLYGVPHGLVCSVCFAPSIRLNRQVMGGKYENLSRAVGGDFLETVEGLLARLEIVSPFAAQSVLDPEKIIRETLESGSTAANPKPIVREDVESLLAGIFGQTPGGSKK